MSSRKIRCDFTEINRVIRIFKDQGGELTRMTKKLMSEKDTLACGDWVGRGAKQFYADMDQEIIPSLHRLIRAMDSGASHLGKAHKIMSQANEDLTHLYRVVPTVALRTGPGSGDFAPTGPGSGDEVPADTSSTQATGPGSGDEEPSGPGSGDELPATSSTQEPRGPGSGDVEPSGPGSGDEMPATSSTQEPRGPGSGDVEPSGPGSGDEMPATSSTQQPRGPGSGDVEPSGPGSGDELPSA